MNILGKIVLKKSNKLLLATLCALCYTNTYAGFVNGNQIASYIVEYEKANRKDPSTNYQFAERVVWYIFGVADVLDNNSVICLPDKVSSNQILEVVIKYLKDHPERWNEPAEKIIGTPLIHYFPCKK